MENFASQRAITELDADMSRSHTTSQPRTGGEPLPPSKMAKKRSSPGAWKRTAVWIIVLAIVIAGIVYAAVRRTQTGNQSFSGVQRTALVKQGDFIRSVRVNGTVEAVESHPVEAPRLAIQSANALVLTTLLPTGAHVHKGDLVAEFDRQSQVRDALDREAEFNDFVQQINKLAATQAADKAVDDTDIKAAEDSLANAELEVKRSEVMSRIDAEKKHEDLDEATAKLKQLRATYLVKRQSAAAALQLLIIQRDGKKLAMEHSRKNTDLLSIHAPTDGLIVVNSTWRNSGGMSEWQEGDQVRAGTAFMQVVNPSSMRVRAQVNQEDLPGLQESQPIDIRLDAYPDIVFHGHVGQITSIGVADDFSPKLHTFIVLFSIDGSDPKLLPDLSAAVDVELERAPNVLSVPRDALIAENGRMYVRVVSGNSSEKREVKVSKLNEIDALVDSGVRAGETVLRGVAPESPRAAGTAAAQK
jgi:HlyD family secretion protein